VNRLVVDASVVVKWFLPEVLAEAALPLAASDRAFLAPELIGAEFANALWKKQLRREVEGPSAAGILDHFRRVAIETFSLIPLLPDAFAIASAAGHSVYDASTLRLPSARIARWSLPTVASTRLSPAAICATACCGSKRSSLERSVLGRLLQASTARAARLEAAI
jgi:predicted nucleic acid-binding protein